MQFKPCEENEEDDPLEFELAQYPRLQSEANVLCYIAKAEGDGAALPALDLFRSQLVTPVSQTVRDGILGDLVQTICNMESNPFIKRRRLIAK